MKKLFLAIAIGFLTAASAHASEDSCPKHEYAELKDMSKEELMSTRCHDLKRSDEQIKMADKLAKLGLTADGWKAIDQSDQCTDEAKRIADILKREGVSDLPSCDKPEAVK